VERSSLFVELKRRRVFRALVGYGIAAFAVLQIIEPVMHGLHWPDAVLSYVVVALALGFPIVVGLAWIFDVNEGRIERTAGKPADARLRLLLVAIGVLAAAPGLAWYFFIRGRPAAVAPAAEAGPSIAVLPLVNMSSDKEQEYFSDGLSEELLNLLSKVSGLRVAARTSAFAFKGKNEDVGEIGQKLHAPPSSRAACASRATRSASPPSSSTPPTATISGRRRTTASSPTCSRCRTRSRARWWLRCASS
jgi:hypothetical protein